MKTILDRLKAEPALVVGFVRSVLVLLIVLGIAIDEETKAAILGVVTMGLSLVTRSLVQPKDQPEPETERSE